MPAGHLTSAVVQFLTALYVAMLLSVTRGTNTGQRPTTAKQGERRVEYGVTAERSSNGIIYFVRTNLYIRPQEDSVVHDTYKPNPAPAFDLAGLQKPYKLSSDTL